MASGIEAVGSRRDGSDKELKRTLQKLAPPGPFLANIMLRTSEYFIRTLNEPRHEKTCRWGFATGYDSNKLAQRHKLASLKISNNN